MILTSGFRIENKVDTGVEPISLDMIKSHLSITFDDANDLLELLAVAAREEVEEYLGLSIVDKNITCSWSSLSCAELPYSPIKEVVSTTDGTDDISTDVTYIGNGYIRIDANRIENTTVSYKTGFTGGVPVALKLAILKLTADHYEQRISISIGGNQTIQTFNNDWKNTCKRYSRKHFLQ